MKHTHGGDRESVGERWVGVSNVLVGPRRLGWNSASDSEGGGFSRWGGSGEIGGPLNLGFDHAIEIEAEAHLLELVIFEVAEDGRLQNARHGSSHRCRGEDIHELRVDGSNFLPHNSLCPNLHAQAPEEHRLPHSC